MAMHNSRNVGGYPRFNVRALMVSSNVAWTGVSLGFALVSKLNLPEFANLGTL